MHNLLLKLTCSNHDHSGYHSDSQILCYIKLHMWDSKVLRYRWCIYDYVKILEIDLNLIGPVSFFR